MPKKNVAPLYAEDDRYLGKWSEVYVEEFPDPPSYRPKVMALVLAISVCFWVVIGLVVLAW